MPEEKGQATAVAEVAPKAEVLQPKDEGSPAPAEAPLTQEMVKELVAAESKKFQSHFQSIADKQVAASRREAQAAQAEALELRQRLVALDPEQAEKLELEGYRRQAKGQAAESGVTKQQEDIARYFETVQETLKEAGLSVDDKRMDWGYDAPTFTECHKRVHTSLAKVLKEEKAKREAAHQQALKDHEAKWRKEAGLDRIDNSPSGGGRGKIPSLEELQATPAHEAVAKYKSGEWIRGKPK